MLLAMILSLSLPSKAQTRQEIIQNITETAVANNIDPDLALAVATVESSLNPKAIGNLGEVGLFQLRPEYHNVIFGNTTHNIKIGIQYLRNLKEMCEAKYDKAWFVCYNYGPHSKLKYPQETKYYKKVVAEVNKLKFKRYLASGF
jgi:soluble lytic murein transglycosylase-like protein